MLIFDYPHMNHLIAKLSIGNMSNCYNLHPIKCDPLKLDSNYICRKSTTVYIYHPCRVYFQPKQQARNSRINVEDRSYDF